MKKYIAYILVVVWSVCAMSVSTVSANNSSSSAKKTTLEDLLPTKLSGQEQKIDKFVDSFPFGSSQKDLEDAVEASSIIEAWNSKLAEVNKLPKGSPESLIAGIISMILGLGGMLTMLAMVVAGVMYIIAQDNEDLVNSAKKIMTYSLIGLIVISVSFAIFTGLSRLFF